MRILGGVDGRVVKGIGRNRERRDGEWEIDKARNTEGN